MKKPAASKSNKTQKKKVSVQEPPKTRKIEQTKSVKQVKEKQEKRSLFDELLKKSPPKKKYAVAVVPGKIEHKMLKSFSLNGVLDKAFHEVKRNMKNQSVISPLIKVSSELSKEISAVNMRNQQMDEIECSNPYSYRTMLATSYQDAEKKIVLNTAKKFYEEDKKIKNIMKGNNN